MSPHRRIMGELGFSIASDAKSERGVEFIPLPAEVQDYRTYVVGVVACTTHADAARALSSPQAKAAMAARGCEPR